MPHRLNGGLALGAIGAVLLLVSLFLDWFAPGRSAWTVFEIDDLVLAGLALLVLGVALADVLARPEPQRYFPEGSVVWAGVGALIIVVATLIQPPPAALHSSREIGAWLGLGGAVLMMAGGILMRARISLVIALRSPEPPRHSDQTEDVEAYEPTAPYESRGYEPEEYEREEPESDPDTETRQFSEPPS
jgi:hypothetical protein